MALDTAALDVATAAAGLYPPTPTLALARRRKGKDWASRQAQAHRRWTSIAAGSEAWRVRKIARASAGALSLPRPPSASRSPAKCAGHLRHISSWRCPSPSSCCCAAAAAAAAAGQSSCSLRRGRIGRAGKRRPRRSSRRGGATPSSSWCRRARKGPNRPTCSSRSTGRLN